MISKLSHYIYLLPIIKICTVYIYIIVYFLKSHYTHINPSIPCWHHVNGMIYACLDIVYPSHSIHWIIIIISSFFPKENNHCHLLLLITYCLFPVYSYYPYHYDLHYRYSCPSTGLSSCSLLEIVIDKKCF